MRDEVTCSATLRLVGAAPILAARGLCYDTAGRRLLDAIDLDIPPGRTTAILGPNGAGKSLLLRLMHGLLRPSAGSLLWQGEAMTGAARRAQAMVFQRPVLLRRSVQANLRFALAARGYRGADRTTRERQALDRARLTHLAARPARVLSGGEQQRLAVASALSADPELLFLDEPTASLDPASTQAIESLLSDARASGVTIVLVTHDAGQARRLADDAVFLSAGRVAESGPAADVLDHPRTDAARAWRDGRIHLSPHPT